MVDYSNFSALIKFIEVIENAVGPHVDGDRFFDMLDDNIEMEFMCAPPGTPKGLSGKQAIIDTFDDATYGDILILESCTLSNFYRTDKPGVVIVEYTGKGHGPKTGKPYDQRYLSILTIKNGKIVHWRDYWDGIAALEPIGGIEALNAGMYKKLN